MGLRDDHFMLLLLSCSNAAAFTRRRLEYYWRMDMPWPAARECFVARELMMPRHHFIQAGMGGVC